MESINEIVREMRGLDMWRDGNLPDVPRLAVLRRCGMTDEQNDEVCDEARDLCRNCSHAAMCWDTCRAYEERYDEIAKAKGYDTEGGAE